MIDLESMTVAIERFRERYPMPLPTAVAMSAADAERIELAAKPHLTHKRTDSEPFNALGAFMSLDGIELVIKPELPDGKWQWKIDGEWVAELKE